MITATERARFLEWQDIGWLFDNTELVNGTRWVGADFAELFGRKKPAAAAWVNGCSRAGNAVSDLLRLPATRADHPEGDAFGRSRPYARHLPQLRDQFPDCSRI